MWRYFISWIASFTSTLLIVGLFFLLIFTVRDFENPGGIYFYIYFVFPEIWIGMTVGLTLLGSTLVARKQGWRKIGMTVLGNLITGVGLIALAIFSLWLFFLWSQTQYKEKVQLMKENLSIENVQWLPQDTDQDGKFNKLLVSYTLQAGMDIGYTRTFVGAGAKGQAAIVPYFLTLDNTYNRTQRITQGTWACELLLEKYSWDEKSETKLQQSLAVKEKTLSIIINLDHTHTQLIRLLIKEVPLPLDFKVLDTEHGSIMLPESDQFSKKTICAKMP